MKNLVEIPTETFEIPQEEKDCLDEIIRRCEGNLNYKEVGDEYSTERIRIRGDA